MAINKVSEVEFGEDLPAFVPDTTLETVKTFAALVGWTGARFGDHEAADHQGHAERYCYGQPETLGGC